MNGPIGQPPKERSQARTESELLMFIRERLHIEIVDPGDELFESGLIDSLSFVDLLMILSTEYGIDVDVADLDTDNFHTVRRIAAYVVAHPAATIEP